MLELERDSEHPSAHALARLQAGELDEAERGAIQAHLDGCQACQEALERLSSLQECFQAEHPREGFLAAVRARAEERARPAPALPQILAWTAGAALVALIAIAALRPAFQEGSGQTRVKGAGLELGYYVLEGDRAILGGPGRVLHAGDRIQFRLSGPRGGFVHLVGVDEAGQVSVYYPRPAEVSEPFPGGSGRPVPGSVVLDATLGRERVFALVCPRAFERQALDGLLHGMAADVRVLLDRERLDLDCSQTSLLLVKE